MSDQIITPKAAQKQILALPAEIAARINEAILALEGDPRPDGVVKMNGSDRIYRIRVGDYRVMYKIDDDQLVILIVRCKHRREVSASLTPDISDAETDAQLGTPDAKESSER
jgi:mRNA interferase RelE/StbE